MSENKKRQLIGSVSSSSADKTITVLIERKVKHPIYGKFQRKTTKYYAHDEKNQCSKGDLVSIEQTRPLSKTKCWNLVEIIGKSR